ncbi:glycoside hydrolase family 5 protein [Podospora didyma]|uniref:glucan endo-1,6-beta-glucosidase n=1 Tax=Podospora didyma TaxID=330526 RepID=A0AAE0NG86_9PEZI|nr:glycoside hydrolase family 5 protein [Podospora didyma]
MRPSVLSTALLAGLASAWLPHERELPAFNMSARYEQLGKRWNPHLASGITKIRGVNFGGWLISEPWMMCHEWTANMGCGSDCNNYAQSEFDCMLNSYKNNRAAGNAAFARHWQTWINAGTVQSAHDVGLNTIRIPIGYWSYADIVDKASEPFADPAPMLAALDAVIQKCADLGMYVIIDLHGAPGGQQEDAFTGQLNRPAGFYNSYNFERAKRWMSWMTRRIHTTPSYQATVGMIEVLNEPVSQHDGGGRYPAPGEVPGLTQDYYPGALQAVRDAERALGVSDGQALHVQFMDAKWLAGDPRASSTVANDGMTAFDDHNYIGFGVSNNKDQQALMESACTDHRQTSGENFIIAGEWSLTCGVDWNNNQAFFTKWFTAQQQLYEEPGMAGWVYWTWKTELNDPRWTYSHLTSLNWIPTNAAALQQNVFQDVCQPWR